MSPTYAPGDGFRVFSERHPELSEEAAQREYDSARARDTAEHQVYAIECADGGEMLISFDEGWWRLFVTGNVMCVIDPQAPRELRHAYHLERVLSDVESGHFYYLDNLRLSSETAADILTDHRTRRTCTTPSMRTLKDGETEAEIHAWAERVFDPRIEKHVVLQILYED